jgi:hypothetical protein
MPLKKVFALFARDASQLLQIGSDDRLERPRGVHAAASF